MELETWPRRHRLTAEEYHRMGEVGLLAPDARVELIEGEIIDMPPIGSRHAGMVGRLNQWLMRAVGNRAIVWVQSPVRLNQWSEPQPDLALLRSREDFYSRRHPAGPDTLLAVEVSDSTLRYDREIKTPLYAGHGVPEVWIVNLRNGLLHVYRSPQNGAYAEAFTLDNPGLTVISALPGIEIELTNLFAV